MSTLGDLPELVRDSRLVTEATGVETVHIRPSARRNRPRREKWILTKVIGQGGGGSVWLQKQVEGSEIGTLRAVKVIRTDTDRNSTSASSSRRFVRELEATAKFSQEKVS